MFAPKQISQERSLTPKQRAVVIVMNLMLLAELTWAMYRGQQHPETLTAVFLRTFIPMVVVTFGGARILLRKFAPRFTSITNESSCENDAP
jgi:hypothetical protein